MKEDEMGGACSTNGEKRNLCSLLVGKQEEDHQENHDVGGWIILRLILERKYA
jgi:hypothetical protein